MTNKDQLYRKYSIYLKEKYGEKVYKLPINLPVSCPNRDGVAGYGGCTFCGEEGAGFENLSNSIPIPQQLKKNKDYISKKYKARKFIAYFQNFSNTYMPLKDFKAAIKDSIIDGVVQIAISTRPDCIRKEYLDFLKTIQDEYKIDISIELGLQSVNYHSLLKINRGHTLGEFIDAVLKIKNYSFEICTHLILNLPWDTELDVIENAKILSALSINQVKLHSLYIVNNTVMGRQYKNKEFDMISLDEYKRRVIIFLEYLSPDIVIQRLIGRAPEENTLFVNWNTSWWKIRDAIEEEMKREGKYQGRLFDYLDGKAIKRFL
ncbi:MAG TPA: TIGR01212 family radical SAM protein [Defluviitaleaceae bacterium]|jgi:radical SAM protein (TIGR01212 family)|nr:TIGR01212 family radical SAM protein [Candidatus Epulonipiscium sp.]HOA80126.1 TIGR01212 family radical SAM protein [Defluviitaleaceae bacterium]